MQNDKLDNYLRTYRKKLGLTQREVAFLLGCHGGAKVSRYERSGPVPTLKTIFAYEAIFQKPARELFAGIHDRTERETLRRARLLVSRLRKRQESPALARKIASLRAVVDGGPEDLRYESLTDP
jgi:transcriptional regulator with XRE-family HTH domain